MYVCPQGAHEHKNTAFGAPTIPDMGYSLEKIKCTKILIDTNQINFILKNMKKIILICLSIFIISGCSIGSSSQVSSTNLQPNSTIFSITSDSSRIIRSLSDQLLPGNYQINQGYIENLSFYDEEGFSLKVIINSIILAENDFIYLQILYDNNYFDILINYLTNEIFEIPIGVFAANSGSTFYLDRKIYSHFIFYEETEPNAFEGIPWFGYLDIDTATITKLQKDFWITNLAVDDVGNSILKGTLGRYPNSITGDFIYYSDGHIELLQANSNYEIKSWFGKMVYNGQEITFNSLNHTFELTSLPNHAVPYSEFTRNILKNDDLIIGITGSNQNNSGLVVSSLNNIIFPDPISMLVSGCNPYNETWLDGKYLYSYSSDGDTIGRFNILEIELPWEYVEIVLPGYIIKSATGNGEVITLQALNGNLLTSELAYLDFETGNIQIISSSSIISGESIENIVFLRMP